MRRGGKRERERESCPDQSQKLVIAVVVVAVVVESRAFKYSLCSYCEAKDARHGCDHGAPSADAHVTAHD